ncbi:LLM class flavin-dependent oxidoreductase [Roseomonas sp. KE0001]|uniref:LLM class flavin-dependent oxidoreductase n=1 Tax=Roseomonas sp. KE0001 TaxID=2479201 RepID=UPI0018DF6370|nr:LLM class flavin-dependent oxidoreductase [Roseomonas sp. KE0001]MBI0436092.1 LLM class flavin-dependent oxidoreductase [Roseomonas sp. KE0001]
MTAKRPRQIHLGCFPIHLGGNVGAWRHPEVQANGSTDLQWVLNLARIAEAGKLDLLFVADSTYASENSTPFDINHFEPITILSACAAVTRHIGVVATMSTSYSQPFTTARQIASLDKLSGGRAAWNAVTSSNASVARNYSGDKLMEHDHRYRIAREYIEVVKGLWDSWEDDAFPRDKQAGVYFDASKMHRLNHVGEFFKVQGPLNIERSPQGQPVIFQAGASEAGRDLAARHADAVFSNRETIDECRLYTADLRARAARYGRPADEFLVMPVITPIVGGTEEEARRRARELNEMLDPKTALSFLSRYFSSFDFWSYDLDAPVPDLSGIVSDANRSSAEYLMRIAREEKLTLRQLAYRAAAPRKDFTGTPEQIADRLQLYFETQACDGFMMATDISPRGLSAVTEHVVPILQKRGLFRTEYEGTTLRDHLGLSHPESRYVARPSPAVA